MKQAIEPVALAVIGVGRMGSLYGQLSHEMALTRLAAICGEDSDATARMAASWDASGYDAGRYRQMLDEIPEIEAVIVATPGWAHTGPVMAALEAGKHVLLEKPMAISPDAASQMTACAERLGLTLMVCHSLRFNSRLAMTQQSVAQGKIGRVIHMYARRHSLQPAVDRPGPLSSRLLACPA
jgi:UDP-N-acetylglucosamine 3-dehydrogenase